MFSYELVDSFYLLSLLWMIPSECKTDFTRLFVEERRLVNQFFFGFDPIEIATTNGRSLESPDSRAPPQLP